MEGLLLENGGTRGLAGRRHRAADCRPWLGFYGHVPRTIAYPDSTLYDMVMDTVRRIPDRVAYDFLGSIVTYREFGHLIDRAADAFAALGLRPGDRITIALPTCPQGVIAFYAASKLGAIPAMIHPLCTAAEVERLLELSRSRFALTLDACYDRFAGARGRTPLERLILTRISDALSPWKKLVFRLTRRRKVVPRDALVRWWKDLLGTSHPAAPRPRIDAGALAAVLFSGGTLGTPKGILLSHRNFISQGLEAAAWVNLGEADRVLCALPIFHGFGLGALVNASFMRGCRVILVPTFSAPLVARLIRQKRPSIMAGVPTLYDSLGRDPRLAGADLSCLRAAFSGGDTLPGPVKARFERLIAQRGGRVRLLEGYGLTETVTAIMATPLEGERTGSLGIPFPDTLVRIHRAGSEEELGPGEDGEICVSGPAVMLGYLDDPAATADVLRRHRDGRVWLHTGDIGRRDEDGFFYFRGRLKRMIKSSGFNVYPAEVEAVLSEHPAVAEAHVVGVPDEAQGQRVKAFVVPRMSPGAELAETLDRHCRSRLIKWSCPRDIEFCRELPRTGVGKVDERALLRSHG